MAGASCDKKSAAGPDEARDVVNAIDKVEGGSSSSAAAVNDAPLPGVDVSALDAAKKQRFYQLVDKLHSPCGKAHSLRTSVNEDTSCKRATFAARYVAALLEDEGSDDEIRDLYARHYPKNIETKSFKLDGVPVTGPADAPVKLVEFFDYGCPACKEFAPMLKEALSEFPGEAALYYKMFPLSKHTHSKLAAQAALAAAKQGKFEAMHELLFQKSPMHETSALMEYAKSLGLDMKRFEADFAAALAQVTADVAEGDEAGIMGTPSLYINGRVYEGPLHPRYLRLWIEEELAVNR